MADLTSGQDVDILPGDNTIGRVKITDGTDVADVLDLTNSNPVVTAIVDGNGDQITSFGGGTQYTEGDIDASITGTAMMWEDTSDTLRAVSSAKPLPISVATIPSHAVTNAGTFVVQENGAALTALQLIDDTVATLGTTTYTETTTKGLTIGAVRRDADTTLVNTTNEIGPLQMDANGRLKVEAFSGEALPITDNSGSITIDAPVGTPVFVTTTPSATGGWDTKNCTSSDGSTALTNSAQAIKASAGNLGGWYIYNPNTTAAYVQIYNTASGSVTVGTTNPLFMATIPPGSAANVEWTNGITFSTAISAAATSVAGTNAALTTALDAVFFYK